MNFKKLISLSLVALLLLVPAMAFMPVKSEPTNKMWIEPASLSFDTATVSVGYKFNVTVYIHLDSSPTDNCGAWQFKLLYDPNYLLATRAGYTAGSKSEFFSNISTVPLTPSFGPNYVLHGESWGGVGPLRSVPGEGSLSWVEFEVIATPGKGETINLVLDIASAYPSDTYALDEDGNSIPMDVYNCEITYTWSPPPVPTLTVDPLTRFYDRYSHWVNTTFTEDVMFDDLNAAWFVTNVSCTITFDPSFLEVLSVTFDPVWNVATSYTIDNVAGTVDLFAETSQSISGDVVIATLEFNITSQGTYPEIYESDLDFASYTVFDHTINITEVYGTNVVPGHITVEGYLAVHMPHLEAVSYTHLTLPTTERV